VDGNSKEDIPDLSVPPFDFDVGYQMHKCFESCDWYTFSVTKVLKDNMQELEYGNDKKPCLSVEALEVLTAMPGFGEGTYCFVKIFCCKEEMRPFNGTVTTVLPKERYIVHWDSHDGKSETISHAIL
jgi:hypothetical protein